MGGMAPRGWRPAASLAVLLVCTSWAGIQAFSTSPAFLMGGLTGLRASRRTNSVRSAGSVHGSGARAPLLPKTRPGAAAVRMSAAEKADIAIVGSGPTGLAAAIMLAQRGYQGIKVYDRLPQPPDVDSASWGDGRSYNVGLSGRGQKALRDLKIMDEVDAWCADVNGRMDWTPGATEPRVTMLSGMKGYTTKVIQRDRLASCLLEVLRERHSDAVDVQFEARCSGVQWGAGNGVELTVEGGGGAQRVTARAVIGADGVGSFVREAMQSADEAVKVKRFEDDNRRVYRPVRLQLPDTVKSKDLSFSMRTDSNLILAPPLTACDLSSVRTDSDLILEGLPTKEGQLIGVLLFREDDERVNRATTEAAARELFEQHMPMVVDYVVPGGFDFFAQEPAARLPAFQYCGPVLHRGGQAVLLGDAIHCVKPYFGLGVNSAFEDVTVLGDCLDECGGELSGAFKRFSEERGEEAVVLVEEQQHLDRPGVMGLVNFVLPIVLDSYLSKAFPQVFRPPIQNMMQQPGSKFSEVRARKRIDRAGQVVLATGGLVLAFQLVGVVLGAVQAVLASGA